MPPISVYPTFHSHTIFVDWSTFDRNWYTLAKGFLQKWPSHHSQIGIQSVQLIWIFNFLKIWVCFKNYLLVKRWINFECQWVLPLLLLSILLLLISSIILWRHPTSLHHHSLCTNHAFHHPPTHARPTLPVNHNTIITPTQPIGIHTTLYCCCDMYSLVVLLKPVYNPLIMLLLWRNKGSKSGSDLYT